jgi:hypothetical protein
VRGLGTRSAALDLTMAPAWYWIAALGPLAVVVVLFVGEVVVDRFRVPPAWLRMQGRGFAQLLVVPAFVTVAVLIGMPLVLVWANNFGLSQAGDQPDTGTMDGLADGIVGAASSVAGTVAGSGAAGADALLDSQFGLGTLAALGAAFIALARSAWKGLESAKDDGPGPDLRSRILTWARVKLVPWLGSALLLVAGLVVLLRWTAGYVASEEWRSRWWVAALCAGLVLLIMVLTDATRTSLHPYYRERLATAYLARRTSTNTATDYDYAMAMPYSTWGAATDDGPQLVIVASANAFDADFIPPGRGCVPFVFDPGRTGVAGDVSLPTGGLEETAAYEQRADFRRRDVTVPGAVAISGAAFAPLTGRANARTRPMRLLFAVVNARLGVWLPNPYWGSTCKSGEFARRCAERAARPEAGATSALLAKAAATWAQLVSVADKPGVYRLFKEAVGRTSLYDNRLYVTDGGHYDNLGLVEALRRRPRRVIVLDASSDVEDTFETIGSAIAMARMDLGVEVELDPRRLRRMDGPRIDRGWVTGRARHPDGSETEILFVKALLAGQLSWDLESYAAAHLDFPRRTTGDQLYGEFDFEAYRALGYATTQALFAHLDAHAPTRRALGSPPPDDTDALPAAEADQTAGELPPGERAGELSAGAASP